MPSTNVKNLLEQQHIKYACINHSPTFTAQETAQSSHIPGHELAKTVIIKLKDHLAMIVLAAEDKINFKTLEKSLGWNNVTLATERDFKDKFPECEVGAMPPFGNLYGMEVYIDEKLTRDPEIAFNSGSHSELIRMAYADFARIVHPRVLHAA
jgi:Ala-tRNA(Pro) deacylase